MVLSLFKCLKRSKCISADRSYNISIGLLVLVLVEFCPLQLLPVQMFNFISIFELVNLLVCNCFSNIGKSIKDCKALYLRFKDQVFVGKRPYDADLLEGFLRNEFGQLTMSDLDQGPK